MSIPKSVFGLIGKRLDYSFSRAYFSQKFEELKLNDHEYKNFEIGSEDELLRFRESVIYDTSSKTTAGKSEILRGLNVTIPYKESVFEILDSVDDQAREIGAVNTIAIEDNQWKGYNTDAYGFLKSLEPFLPILKNALVLGTGGASKAVAYALESLGIAYLKVSRNPLDEHTIDYKSITHDVLDQVTLIVNTTPLGTHPEIHQSPPLPYQFLGDQHLLYDLVYNPARTMFMKLGIQQGAQVINGQQMLVHQAEKAWQLWNE
jgi:shikimate dehydrogenase